MTVLTDTTAVPVVVQLRSANETMGTLRRRVEEQLKLNFRFQLFYANAICDVSRDAEEVGDRFTSFNVRDHFQSTSIVPSS